MNKKKTGKKRSGSDFKKLRDEAQRNKSAKSCKKLTDIYTGKVAGNVSHMETEDPMAIAEIGTEGSSGSQMDNSHANDNSSINVTEDSRVDFTDDSRIGVTDNSRIGVTDNSRVDVTEISKVITDSSDFVVNEDVLAHTMIDFSCKYPSDPFNLQNKPLTPEIIRMLLEIGPCQPGKDDHYAFPAYKSRKFQKEWYIKTLENGLTADRKWLSYSPSLNRMFCWPCILFADKSTFGYDKTFADATEGCKNFKKGTEKIKNHECSGIHSDAVSKMLVTRFTLEKDYTVVKGLLDAKKKKMDSNREVLTRLVDATLFLSKQNLPFRAHREKGGKGSDAENEGNFLELLKLLSKYDPVLKHHLEFAKKNETYLSPDIQNDLISALSNCTLQQIVDNVRNAKYYSLIIDGTIDISRIDQCSLSIRYVNKKGRAEEHFISFEELEGAGAADYFNVLMNKLQELGIDIADCRGQSYDGASNMSGKLTGLQTRVKEIAGATALYVHCCAHLLNLVLCDIATKTSNEAKLFFGTLQKIYTFMTESLPRLNILQKNIEESENESKSLRLKRHSETRWSSRKQCVDAVLSCLPALHKSLVEITEGKVSSLKPHQFADAHALVQQIESFNFHFQLHCWQQILSASNILSNYLQSSSIDLCTASKLIDGFQHQMAMLRSEESFENIKDVAKKTLVSLGISDIFVPTRRFSTYDEADLHLKCQIFYALHDKLQAEIDDRFRDFSKMCGMFSALNPKNYRKKENEDQLIRLCNHYANDVNVRDVLSEFSTLMSTIHEIFTKGAEVDTHLLETKDVLAFLIDAGMDNLFPNICILYSIFLTIPVSSAQAERSFSRLKLIKSYLRVTMGQVRLAGLSLLSIEREMASKCDYKNVIDTFAAMKVRRKKL